MNLKINVIPSFNLTFLVDVLDKHYPKKIRRLGQIRVWDFSFYGTADFILVGLTPELSACS